MISFPSLRMAVQWKDQVFDSGHDCLQGADVIIAPMRTFPGTITHVILHLYFVSDIAVFVLKRDIKLQLTNSPVFYKLTNKSPSSWPLAAKNCQVVGRAGSTTGTVHADVTLTRSKVKVKVMGLLNFRKLAKPCIHAGVDDCQPASVAFSFEIVF